jgi:hypothetical protein
MMGEFSKTHRLLGGFAHQKGNIGLGMQATVAQSLCLHHIEGSDTT